MNDLRIIITDIKQLKSQTIKTKIKRFLLRKRKIKNVSLAFGFQSSLSTKEFATRRFKQIKQEVLHEMEIGKSIPVKF